MIQAIWGEGFFFELVVEFNHSYLATGEKNVLLGEN